MRALKCGAGEGRKKWASKESNEDDLRRFDEERSSWLLSSEGKETGLDKPHEKLPKTGCHRQQN